MGFAERIDCFAFARNDVVRYTSLRGAQQRSSLKLFAVVLMAAVFAQTASAEIVFDSPRVDSIVIVEEDGPREFVFEFTNTGDVPAVVTRIETSCGCTAAEYTRQPVAAGERGEVKVIYNPGGYGGTRLSRVVSVYTAESGIFPAARLELSGEVTTRDPWAGRYRVALGGDLRAKRGSVSFGVVLPSQVRRERIECVNIGDKPLKVSAMAAPKWLRITTVPEVLEPGAVGDLWIEIYGAVLCKTEKSGRVATAIILEGIGGRKITERTIYVFAEVEK